jgi:hypothetical protein
MPNMWLLQISFVTQRGEFAYRGKTAAASVEAARTDAGSWR